MIFLTQFDGSKLNLHHKPATIISLVPSITENLIQFGTNPIARTSFCIEPSHVVKQIPVIGGTKTPRVTKIISMKPDLVIANQEENIKVHIEEIQSHGIPVWVTMPVRMEDLISLTSGLGSLCENNAIAKDCEKKLKELLAAPFQRKRKIKTITLIWKEPWMAVGRETYTSHLLDFCGFENPVPGRYPEISHEEIEKLKPDLIILPTEPYEFSEDDLMYWNKTAQATSFCGEDLLWSGPRVFKATESLNELYQRIETR